MNRTHRDLPLRTFLVLAGDATPPTESAWIHAPKVEASDAADAAQLKAAQAGGPKEFRWVREVELRDGRRVQVGPTELYAVERWARVVLGGGR